MSMCNPTDVNECERMCNSTNSDCLNTAGSFERLAMLEMAPNAQVHTGVVIITCCKFTMTSLCNPTDVNECELGPWTGYVENGIGCSGM